MSEINTVFSQQSLKRYVECLVHLLRMIAEEEEYAVPVRRFLKKESTAFIR